MHDAATPAGSGAPGMPSGDGRAGDPPLLGVPAPLTFLRGRWTTRRHLLDRSTGTAGTFRGITTFTPHDGGLLWSEQGTVRWPTFQGPASRSYRVTPGTGAGVDVRFDDGRLLCRLDLATGRARDEHACFPDTYLVEFAVRNGDSIDYSWDVTGPAKDLLLTTALSRTCEREPR